MFRTAGVLVQGSAFRIPLRDQSVHCVVTSPPYWGLRKYAGEQGQEPLGLEPTPERHIERTVEWAREVYRVLRDDGVFWLNYGDCYSSSGKQGGHSGGKNYTSAAGGAPRQSRGDDAGNLMMMPHRIALALQMDGWIVRQDLVWAKPNPMPESVAGWRWQQHRIKTKPSARSTDPSKMQTLGRPPHGARDGEDFSDHADEYRDCPGCEVCAPNGGLVLRTGSFRHTRSHEYVFQFVKRPGYWSDQEAVRESGSDNVPWGKSWGGQKQADLGHNSGGALGEPASSAGRNPRSVLHIPTSRYKGAHYATFPPNLIAPLIQATCPRWCCPVCGQGWAPVVERIPTGETQKMADGWDTGDGAHGSIHRDGREQGETGVPVTASVVSSHRPTCDHPHAQADAVPGTVFDPFVGSGTTVMVARQLLRTGIGLDISRPYLAEQALLRADIGQPELEMEDLPLFRGDGHANPPE